MRHINRSVLDRQKYSAMLKTLRCTCSEKFPPLSLPSFLICCDLTPLLFSSFLIFSHCWLKSILSPLCLHCTSHRLVLFSSSIQSPAYHCFVVPSPLASEYLIGESVLLAEFSFFFQLISHLRLIIVINFLHFWCSSSLSLLFVLIFGSLQQDCLLHNTLQGYPPPLGSMGFAPWLSG